MSTRKAKDRGMSNCIVVIALILGVSATVVVSTTQTRAQNQSNTQTGSMPHDLHFIDMMIMHHRQGIAMGRQAERKGSTAALRAFAKKTADDQEKELLELKKHRDHWYAGSPEMDHTQMMAMPGMAGHANMDMQGDIAKLQAATGKQFDRLFLDMMIPHHQMVIDMSKEAVMEAEHAEIREMARMTVMKQQREIAEMNRLKGGGIAKTSKARAKAKSKPKSKPKVDHSMH
ncbi:MAG: DUF305 domain-containing protein [Pyrinomonadaceae bacterium]